MTTDQVEMASAGDAEDGHHSKSSVTAVRDPECLYHGVSLRAQFQHVLNCLRDKLVPKKHLHRLGQLVCSCSSSEEKSDMDANISDVGLDSLKQVLMEFTTRDPALKPSVDVYLYPKKNVYTTSIKRCLFMLSFATKEDYAVFRKRIPEFSSSGQENSEQTFRFRETFTIPMSELHLGLLFGVKGRNIKGLSKLHECDVLADSQKKSVGYSLHTSEVTVTVKTNREDGVERMKKELMEIAKRITENRKKHDERVRAYWLKRAARQVRRRATAGTTAFTGYSEKESAKVTYSKKYMHQQKQGDKRKEKKEKPKVLEQGSRCYRCLAPYDKAAMSTESCRYHPGYVKNTWIDENLVLCWSCCKEPVKEGTTIKGQKAEHCNTGCCTGLHLWKLHKRLPVQRVERDTDNVKNLWPWLKKHADQSGGHNLAGLWLDVGGEEGKHVVKSGRRQRHSSH